jgi:LuxR family maltose regulon positive regulatory protein
LNEGLHVGRKLTLVSAPAGFGKTTLLSEWVHGVTTARDGYPPGRETSLRVSWLSLDRGDNDPVRFWAYVVTALQTVTPDLGMAALDMLQSSAFETGVPPLEAMLTSLINDLALHTDGDGHAQCVLVLDDYHLITSQQIHDTLVYLLDNAPPQLHLAVAGRADPPWPLARVRARGELTEVRASDLRFTPDEAAAFLNDLMGLGLSAQDIDVLGSRTEGWVAGLQMAALSMRGRDVHAFVKTFGASNRFVLDYLVEEVLDRQHADVRAFLLETSILERLTAPLCDALVAEAKGQADRTVRSSQETLEFLERANLFVVPLDDERRWYRYHHLFADLLRGRLMQTQPDLVAALHLRASAWHEENGLVAEAVEHALAAGDVQRVVHLVEDRALDMIHHGELTTLTRWLDALPQDIVRVQPWLCVAYAWALAYSGELDAAEPLLCDAERALAASSGEAKEADPKRSDARLAGHMAAIHGYCALLRGDIPGGVQFAREALEYLPEEDLATRSFAALILGSMLGLSEKVDSGIEVLSQALDTIRAAGDRRLAILGLCELAVLQTRQGQLHDAAATCREALQLAEAHASRSGQQPPAVGFAHIRLGAVLYEWNDLEASLDHTTRAIELFRQWGQKDGLLIGSVGLANLLCALGDVDGALVAIREAGEIAGDLTWYQEGISAFEVRLQLVKDGSSESLLRASRWVQESGLSDESDLVVDDCLKYVQGARLLLALGKDGGRTLEEALRLLTRFLQMVEEVGATRYVIKALALQALALQAQGDQEQAVSALLRALALGEPGGYVRSFVDEGKPMQRLLRTIADRLSAISPRQSAVSATYVHRLLAAFDVSPLPAGRSILEPGTPIVQPDTLVEPLSKRELQVLRLLATSLSAPEIAQELYVSRNTVRTHVKHIYEKLGVHSREQAVERATALGLLGQHSRHL